MNFKKVLIWITIQIKCWKCILFYFFCCFWNLCSIKSCLLYTSGTVFESNISKKTFFLKRYPTVLFVLVDQNISFFILIRISFHSLASPSVLSMQVGENEQRAAEMFMKKSNIIISAAFSSTRVGGNVTSAPRCPVTQSRCWVVLWPLEIAMALRCIGNVKLVGCKTRGRQC